MYIYNSPEKIRRGKVYRKHFCHCHPKNPQTVDTTAFEAAKDSAKVYCRLCHRVFAGRWGVF